MLSSHFARDLRSKIHGFDVLPVCGVSQSLAKNLSKGLDGSDDMPFSTIDRAVILLHCHYSIGRRQTISQVQSLLICLQIRAFRVELQGRLFEFCFYLFFAQFSVNLSDELSGSNQVFKSS